MGSVKNKCLAQSAGFTLIELLVALILLSLIFVLLISGLNLGMRVWREEAQFYTSETSEVRVAQNLLRRLLSEARPIVVQAEDTKKRQVFFFGTENSIRFLAPMLKHLSIGGFYDVAVYLSSGEQAGKRLEMSWRIFRRGSIGSKPAVEERRVTLLKNVADIELTYFGDPKAKKSARWHNGWQDSQYLPDLIRLHIRFRRSDRLWPDLVVAPRARSATVLVFDEETGERGY